MSTTIRRKPVRVLAARAALALLIGGACAAGIGGAASADTNDNDGFEGFAVGDPVGQFGWTVQDLGVYNASHFDLGIVDPSSVWTGGELGTRALRISNAVTSGGFGNQLQTASLTDEAGETGAENLGFSGGTRQSRLTGSFTFASATRTYQAGLGVTLSPDRGDGARMSWIRLTDQADGLQVEVAYYSNHDYAYAVVASGLSRDEPHVLDFTLDLVDGPNNDVLWVSVGGECGSWAQSGSWEDSHRDWAPGNPTKTVDSLLIRVGGTAVPTVAGGGFFIDDLSLTSSTVPPMPPLGTPTGPVAPSAHVNFTAVSVSGSPVPTNACAPVTTYTVSAWPLGGGAPTTFTSPTPTFAFPTPFGGAFTLTMSATNSQGTSVNVPVSLLFDPVFAGDDGTLAATGTDASVLIAGAAAVATILIGALLLKARARRTSPPR